MKPEKQTLRHVDSLDGLRGIAATIVLIGHTNVALEKPLEVLVSIRQSPLAILINGFGAVHLFFILSGFCLASSAARNRSATDLSQFYVRRFFRIHPPYMFALLAAWLLSFSYDVSQANGGLSRWMLDLAGIHLTVPELLRYLCIPGNAGNQLSAGWSLFVEAVFSFLLPPMMWLVRRSHWALLLGLTAYPALVMDFTPAVLRYGLYFALGIALFEERERLGRFFARLSTPSAALFVIAGLGFFAAPVAFALFYKRSGPILSAIGGTLLVAAAAFLPRVRSFLSAPALAHHGRVSYSFYLLHLPVLTVCVGLVSGPATLFEGLTVLVASLLITTGLAELVYRGVERPSILLGNACCRRIAAWTGARAQVSSLVR